MLGAAYPAADRLGGSGTTANFSGETLVVTRTVERVF